MKKTDHYLTLKKNEQVLLIFNGPHTYVSASWYSDPQVASTRNYMTVHPKGKIKFTDEEGTYKAIKAITNKYERKDSAASFDQLPKEYVMKLVNAIEGYAIEVESFDNVFNLSQNLSKENIKSIVDRILAKGDEHATSIADEMERRRRYFVFKIWHP